MIFNMPRLQLIVNIQVGMVVYSLCKVAMRVATAWASESKEPSTIDKMSGMSTNTMGDENSCLQLTPEKSPLVIVEGAYLHVQCTCFHDPFNNPPTFSWMRLADKEHLRQNCDKVFECSEKRKIPCAKICDGTPDCYNGLDETLEVCYTNVSEMYQIKGMYQVRSVPKTQSLVIQAVRMEDSGNYTCTLKEHTGHVTNKSIQIFVIANSQKGTCQLMFACSKTQLVPCDNVCDGKPDCENQLDEQNCTSDMCYGKFRCKNGMCIDKKFVCDVKGFNHCVDGSDEENCPEIKDTVEIYAKDKEMGWLKTTVYTVIACTVGVVLLIAIIVVAIFRIKMKRAAVRRAFRQSDHRQRHSRSLEGRLSGRGLRNSVMENEPFISAPSPTHFGNIIVNVNNGVQFVPNTDLSAALQGPPSYSEVIAMETRGRHSPPPDYSTIDRNPRHLDDPVSDITTCHHVPAPPRPDTVIQSSGNNDTDTGDSDVATRGSESSQSISVNDLQVSSPGAAACVLPEGTSSLGRRNGSQGFGSRGRQVRNVRAHPLPVRPKQLQVRNGQIVLDGNSSESSSPETVNRNTQTNPTDLARLQQNQAKPGQLQVERGQIILSSPGGEGDSVRNTTV